MEDNGIIFIESSDEENSPCKVRKYDTQLNPNTGSYNFNDIQISKLKTQPVQDDVIVVEELDLLKDENETPFSPDNEKHTFNFMKTKSDTKRIELTTVTAKLSDSIQTSKPRILNKNSPASTAETDLSIELESFLEACKLCNCDTKYKNMMMKKIPDLRNRYIEADESFVKNQNFTKYLIYKTKKVKQRPSNAIIIFNEVYRELESKKKQHINLTDREKCHLRKLQKALKKVHRKVVHLENQEVNFEDDSNSSYIMLERYKDRFCTIQKKICSLTNENFYLGRELFKNLNCKISTYPEINRAINKLYNKKKQFPSFYEVDNCIRKCVERNNLNLSENTLYAEIRSVFTDVGQVLQRRRKSELHDSLSYFMDESCDDPAENDPEFESMLQTRHLENEKKIDAVLQKYADCQEKDETGPVLSSDSDDSHYTSEESEA